MLLFAVGLAGILYLGLTAQPASTVLLLPDADGRVGSVAVQSDTGAKASLATAFTSAQVDRRGDISTGAQDPQQIQQRYAQTLEARPNAPVSFVLVFEFGSAVDIAPTFKPVLDRLLATLSSFPAPEITVIGHTDTVGSQADNDRLSLQRAETVRNLLLQAGIKASMLTVAGRGERELAVPTPDETAQAQNRRVEINLR